MDRPDAVFPYGITLSQEGKVSIFPAAEIFIQSNTGESISLVFIIDSGATISALPKSDADFFGIEYKKGSLTHVGGLSGKPMRGWVQDISVKLGEISVRMPIVFLDSPSAPRILGRAGIFDRFTIIFEESKRRSGLLFGNSSAAKQISLILDHEPKNTA